MNLSKYIFSVCFANHSCFRHAEYLLYSIYYLTIELPNYTIFYEGLRRVRRRSPPEHMFIHCLSWVRFIVVLSSFVTWCWSGSSMYNNSQCKDNCQQKMYVIKDCLIQLMIDRTHTMNYTHHTILYCVVYGTYKTIYDVIGEIQRRIQINLGAIPYSLCRQNHLVL